MNDPNPNEQLTNGDECSANAMIESSSRTEKPSKMNAPNSNDQLTKALQETLERSGTLDSVRTQLRASILRCMTECLPNASPTPPPEVPPPNENVLINEMIIEYLSFNGYGQSLAVFAAESHPGGAVLGDAFIRNDVGLSRSTLSLPMLYEIVEAAKARRRRK